MKIVAAGDARALAPLYASGWQPDDDIVRGVADMLAAVRARGDAALLELTRRFDAPDARQECLRVALPRLDEARAQIPANVADALMLAHDRIERFHAAQRPVDLELREADGTVLALLNTPLDAIGAYVPGGTAILPSSLLMTVVPAKVAGVPRVAVATPPRRDGTVSPAMIFAAALSGADELYAAGGAQAIAAFAYGTETIAKVDKIVGPGNVWVTEAKRQVFGACAIDGLAGPSEVLVVADDAADARLVAGELLAQAEHGPLARVAAVSTDRALLERVAGVLESDVAREGARSDIVAGNLERGCFLILAKDEAEVLGVIERFAPEHLSLQVREPWALVPHIRHAGAIFAGASSPVAAGDYIAGTNHVLPTSGAARFSSGLRTADFYRTTSLVANSEHRMRADAEPLAVLADFEGLEFHARSAR
ncbi:MAG: histidinol dehydrogenase, partial [Candidatus Eremiobacteraeota bacterium]|nr:histidinol dehydrogenase [Candidatus Eremiobacteraeota bacterium]